ncbi:2-oxoglutarate and iron-dependent oxygenase domain-containing protein [Burkholderia sp. JPY481]
MSWPLVRFAGDSSNDDLTAKVHMSNRDRCAATALPVLDLMQFDHGDAEALANFLVKLREAARDIGFFYLRGHGIDAATIPEVQARSRQFYKTVGHNRWCRMPPLNRLSIAVFSASCFQDRECAGQTGIQPGPSAQNVQYHSP